MTLLLFALLPILLVLPNRAFILCVLAAMWTTRWGAPIGELTVRGENIVGAAAALRVVFTLNARTRVPPGTVIAWGALVAWITLAVFTAVSESPDAGQSMNVVVWTAGGVATAIWLGLQSAQLFVYTVKWGARFALLFMTIGIFAWLSATAGASELFVQTDPAYGGFAAYAFSHEANLFGGLACLWGLVAAFNPHQILSRRLQLVVVTMAPCAVVASHTRAALIAIGFGLVLLFLVSASATRIIQVSVGTAVAMVVFPKIAIGDEGLVKFTSLFDLDQGTGGQRVELSRIAVEEWSQQPPGGKLLGLGFNSFGQRHLDATRPGEGAEAYIGMLPVQLLYDGGLIALVLLTSAAIATIVPVLRGTSHRVAAVVSLVAAYFVISLATSSLWLLQTWVLVGLTWALAKAEHPNRQAADRPLIVRVA